MRWFSVALAAFLASSAAQAALVKVNLIGTTYVVTDSVAPPFSYGESVHGSFTFDAGSLGSSGDPYSFYYGAVTSGFFEIGALHIDFGEGTRLIVSNDEPAYSSLNIDRFMLDQYGTGPSVNGLPFHDIFFNWQDNGGHASDGGLPTAQIGLDAYGPVTGAIDWVAGDALNRVTFVMSATVSPVPEPGAWSLMLGGFGLVGWAMRYRKAATSAGREKAMPPRWFDRREIAREFRR